MDVYMQYITATDTNVGGGEGVLKAALSFFFFFCFVHLLGLERRINSSPVGDKGNLWLFNVFMAYLNYRNKAHFVHSVEATVWGFIHW